VVCKKIVNTGIIWKKNSKNDGANIAWQKLNKKLFFCQKFPPTNEEENTSV
jgi:hypothetical protein